MTSMAVLIAALAVANPVGAAKADEEAVRAAVVDYVEAIHRVQPERIERSVAPELNKLGYMARLNGSSQLVSMNYSQLLGLARTYNKEGKVAKDAPHQIKVLDVGSNIANAKLTASWGVDYILLAKGPDGRWKIRQVLWEGRP